MEKKILCRSSWRKHTANKILYRAFWFRRTTKFFFKNDVSFFSECGGEKKYFAVRREENTWQTRSLPCVLFRAHDKVLLKNDVSFFRSMGEDKIL
jgi:hypothetical protein